MIARAAKVVLAVALAVGVWRLTTLGPAGDSGWLQPASPKQVRILRFYASVGTISPGESAKLCYSVENARAVRIAPPVGEIYPSARHCLEIVPKHTTHYTIWAEGFDGRVAMRSLTLPVEAIPPVLPRWLNFAVWLRNER